jgi:multidrug resistance protein, MATE family
MNLGIDRVLARRIFALAIPVIIGMLSQTTVNVFDTIIVGRLPGNTGIDGVSGIGISVILLWAIGGFLSSVSVGTQAITARRFGEHKPEEAGKTLTNSLLVATTTGVIVTIIGWALLPDVFPFFNKNPNVVRLGSDFCQVRMLGIFSMVTTASFKAFFDGIGKTYVHMTAAIVMNLLNVILIFLLVLGLFGFPRLEVVGAAWATVIATYIGLAIMVAWSLKKDIREKYHYFRLSNINLHVIWEICRLSVPSGLATIFVMSGFGFFYWIIGNLSQDPSYLGSLSFLPLAGPILRGVDLLRPDLASSASWIIISFLMLIFMTSIAFGTATATLVGQNLGAKNPDQAERYGWESAKIGMYIMGAVGILALIWPGAILGIFTNKPEVIEVAKPVMRMMASITSLISAALILVQALFGAGNSKFVMKVEFTLHLTCLIPLSYLLGVVLGLGMLGTWMAAAIYVLLLSSLMAWKFYEGKWKQIQL